MASIKRWLHQRFRWVTGIPLLLVLLGIGVQALAGIGDIDSYLLQGAGWVVYLIAMVGLTESGKKSQSRRTRGKHPSDETGGDEGDAEPEPASTRRPARKASDAAPRKTAAAAPGKTAHKATDAAAGKPARKATEPAAGKPARKATGTAAGTAAHSPEKRAPKQRRAEPAAKESPSVKHHQGAKPSGRRSSG